MKRGDLLSDIIATYQKFDWALRRISLTEKTRGELQAAESFASIASDVLFENSDLDALWFSRASGGGDRETWELRLLSATPYALIEVFEKHLPEVERAERCAQMMEKLRANLSRQRTKI